MTTTTNIKKDKLRQVIERNWEMANSLVAGKTRRDHVEHIYKALEQDYDKHTEKWLTAFIYLQEDIEHFYDDEEWGVTDYRLEELIQKLRSFDNSLKLISPEKVAKLILPIIGTHSRIELPERIAFVIANRVGISGNKTLLSKKVKRGIIQTVLLEAHKIQYDYNAGFTQSRKSFDESGEGIITEICKRYIYSLYKTLENNERIEILQRDVVRINKKAEELGLEKIDESMWKLEKFNTLNSLEQKEMSILQIQTLWCNSVLEDLEDHYRDL